MPRLETIRAEVQRLLRPVPFKPFALSMENGDRVIIEHPENIAFDPSASPKAKRAEEFHVISSKLRHVSNFSAVTSVAQLDDGNGEA